ncbi:RDD family protein [Pelistega ratti]|nr:RDD family protein [Pelistega ratti]
MSNLSFSSPSRLKIFASQMYEGMLLLGLIFGFSLIFDALTNRTDYHRLFYVSQAFIFILIGVYFILSWYRKGQTLPMKTWGIVLCDTEGKRPTIPQLILRYVLAWIFPLIGAYAVHLLAESIGWASITMLVIFTPFLNFIYSWFDKEGLFLHDRIARTRLVNKSIH